LQTLTVVLLNEEHFLVNATRLIGATSSITTDTFDTIIAEPSEIRAHNISRVSKQPSHLKCNSTELDRVNGGVPVGLAPFDDAAPTPAVGAAATRSPSTSDINGPRLGA
jgi:hypothetical protein